MKEIVTVRQIGEKTEGVSQRTGSAWTAQQLLLEWHKEEGSINRLWATMFNTIISKFNEMDVKEGETVCVTLNFSVLTYRTGFIRNEATIVNIERDSKYHSQT
jgi:Mlc titration factor MtfA (ptsG expression regulator)